jgi:hypothetical protein
MFAESALMHGATNCRHFQAEFLGVSVAYLHNSFSSFITLRSDSIKIDSLRSSVVILSGDFAGFNGLEMEIML